MKNIFYEKIDELYICLVEEIEEIGKAINEYKKYEKYEPLQRTFLNDIYNEIQDSSIILLSMFSTVRLKIDVKIDGDIVKNEFKHTNKKV